MRTMGSGSSRPRSSKVKPLDLSKNKADPHYGMDTTVFVGGRKKDRGGPTRVVADAPPPVPAKWDAFHTAPPEPENEAKVKV